MPSKQLHNEVLAGGSETAKHHGPKGRNDLNQSQEQVSWGPESLPAANPHGSERRKSFEKIAPQKCLM